MKCYWRILQSWLKIQTDIMTEIEDIIKKKRIMQAHRLINMKKNPLIKKMTQHENSAWMERTNGILEEFKGKISNSKVLKN